ncbi:GDP-mannose-dependent alpha-(1-6)-phosphatidylinositol monomannoside mannosyltransferase [compost metagenome]
MIPNAIDASLFYPMDKTAARKRLGLAEDKFIMLSGFMPSKVDKHKGTSYLTEAIELLAAKVDVDKENTELIIFGNRPGADLIDFKIKTTYLGTINNDTMLATVYAAADVFLTTTLEDNLPNTVMESLSCGTPVVSFTTGGVPDMVKHKENGYLAIYKSAEDFANGIAWVINYENKSALNERARQTVLENFSMEVVAKKHIELYKTLIQN